MPTQYDDDDHDVVSASVSTASITPGSPPTNLPSKPSDHIDRPVNAKPTTEAEAEVSEPSGAASPSETEAPSSPPTSTPENLLPHYFPTFGVSKRTQIWIYGSLAIIVLFCAGLGTYFYVQHRKRHRGSRDEYEFEMLDDDDDAHAGLNGEKGGKRGKRRAGELYDAFAGESDEELLSESDGEGVEYRDAGPVGNEEEERGRAVSRGGDPEKN